MLLHVSVIAVLIAMAVMDDQGVTRTRFFYVILDFGLHFSAFTYVASYVIVISSCVLLPLLRMTVRQFEEAAETINPTELSVS